MFVGLYSALARRTVTAARAFIAERGYCPTEDDIRTCRRDLIARAQVPPFSDFFSTSGCRDLLFNVMEHQFTIPQINAFLDANHLTFLGFEQLPSEVLEQFKHQFPDPTAQRDLALGMLSRPDSARFRQDVFILGSERRVKRAINLRTTGVGTD